MNTYKEKLSNLDPSMLPNICRTCLKTEELNPIFNRTVEGILIKTLFDKCLTLQVNENDRLPEKICMDCEKLLAKIYSFREQCFNIDFILRHALENITEDFKTDIVVNDEFCSNNDSTGDWCDYENKYCEQKTFMKDLKISLPDDSAVDTPCQAERLSPIKEASPFQCLVCFKVFTTRNQLYRHKKEEKHYKEKNSNHTCEVCNKKFSSSKLNQHMRSHTKEKPFRCDICTQSFSISGNLRRHMKIHTGEKPHICQKCGKGFIQSCSLQVHMKVHSDDYKKDRFLKSYVCTNCGRMFKKKSAFEMHEKRHTGNLISNQENLKTEMTGTNKQLDYVCTKCSRSYKTKYLLKSHELTHGEKSFLCNECGKGFYSKAALQSHLKTHTGERPYSCPVCYKSFAQSGTFDSHMLIHTGLRPYRCNICSRAFTQQTHLRYHRRTHTGEKPYSCPYCQKCFALKGNLTVHVRTHTGETPFLCTACGKGFYDSSSLKKHRRNRCYKLSDENEHKQRSDTVFFMC